MSAPPNTAKDRATPRENIWALKDKDAFGLAIAARLQEWQQPQSGAMALHQTNVGLAYTHFYGMDVDGVGANAAAVTRSGEQGTIAEMRIPAAAGDLRKIWNIIVGPELSWSAVATTTDYASSAQAIVAKNALQYYLTQKGVLAKAKKQELQSLAYAEAALHIPWNEDEGDDVGVEQVMDPDGQPVLDDNGQPLQRVVKSGDIDYRRISTWDIIRDPTAKDFEASKWLIVREWQDRYDVEARCKLRGDLEGAAAALVAASQPTESWRTWRPFNQTQQLPSNFIPVYYAYHYRTPGVPDGLEVEFLEAGKVLGKSFRPLRKAYWKQIPIVRTAPDEYDDTPFPYSKFCAVLGMGQASDALMRDLLTNATATAAGLIWAEDDANTAIPQLGGGPKVLVGPKGSKPPQALELQQSHPEHFKLVGTMSEMRRGILGLDSVTAGQEVPAGWSGALAALVTSTSVQNNSQEQSKWGKFMQDIGNVTLAHIQHHMPTPRKIALAGRARADLVITTEISGPAVKDIERVECTLAPAIQQTDAGKMQMGETALAQKWAKTPQQLQAVFDTGRLDALTDDMSSELMLIRNENEALSRGEQVAVMVHDDHVLHIRDHRSVGASITARQNKGVVDALAAHMQGHVDALKNADPHLLELLGQPSFAQQTQGPPPPSDATKLGMVDKAMKLGGAPTPEAAQKVFDEAKIDAATGIVPAAPGAFGQPAPTAAQRAPVPGQPAPQQQAQAQAPKMPVNPATGQPAQPAAGAPPPGLAVKP